MYGHSFHIKSFLIVGYKPVQNDRGTTVQRISFDRVKLGRNGVSAVKRAKDDVRRKEKRERVLAVGRTILKNQTRSRL